MTNPPPPSSLSEQLLLQALNELSLTRSELGHIGQRIAITETQNEAIISSQEAAARRADAADEGRRQMHSRINEISVNLASVESEVDGLKALAPIVTMLKDASIERNTVRRVLRRFCKNGYVISGGVVTAGVGAWHQWDNFKAILAKLIGAKLGGP